MERGGRDEEERKRKEKGREGRERRKRDQGPGKRKEPPNTGEGMPTETAAKEALETEMTQKLDADRLRRTRTRT